MLLRSSFVVTHDFGRLTRRSTSVRSVLIGGRFRGHLTLLEQGLRVKRNGLLRPISISQRSVSRVRSVLSLFNAIGRRSVGKVALIYGKQVREHARLLSVLSFELGSTIVSRGKRTKGSTLVYVALTRKRLIVTLRGTRNDGRQSLCCGLSTVQASEMSTFFSRARGNEMFDDVVRMELAASRSSC